MADWFWDTIKGITTDRGGKDGTPQAPRQEADLFKEYSDLKGKFGFNYNKDYLTNLAKQKTEEDIANTVADMYASGRQSGAPEGQSEYWATRNMKSAERGELAGIEDRANRDKYQQLGIYQWLEGNKHRDKSFDFSKDMANKNWQLQKDQLALQKQQWEDSQPGFWDDLFGGISALSGAIPFLKKGGEVENDYAGGGEIDGINLTPEEQKQTGETTLALVQEGEVVNSNPTGDLIGRENLKLINDAGNMVNEMFTPKAPLGAKASQGAGGAKKKTHPGLLGGDPNKGLIGRIGDAINGMFADGGEIQPQGQMMGTEQSGMGQDAMQNQIRQAQMIYDQLMTKYQWAKQQGDPNADNFLKQAEEVKQMLDQMGVPVGSGYAQGGEVTDDKEKVQQNYNEAMRRLQEAKSQGNETEASQYQQTINSIYEKMKQMGMMQNDNNAQTQMMNMMKPLPTTAQAPKKKIIIEETK